MRSATIIAAFVAFGLGWLLRLLTIRKWGRIYLSPPRIAFPMICPVCLSPSDTMVEEQSTKRPTTYYVVAQRWEWWGASIPYCSKCARLLFRDRSIGLILGGICILGALFVAPPLT